MDRIKEEILQGHCILGIELGSTRIKAILIDSTNTPIAQGGYDWENSLIDGVWTYSLETVKIGIQTCFAAMKHDVMEKYHTEITSFKAMGISAMMHGYIALDKEDNLLTPFRTWRNTFTHEASNQLAQLFDYPVPERWTISHLYYSIMENLDHVKSISYVTTLAGYVHYILTGEKVIGIGDASGMFPIDDTIHDYNKKFIGIFDSLVKDKGYSWDIYHVLPQVKVAGENAGHLSSEGALILDPTGETKPGIPLCPPEGDAGTGMVATNSIAKNTGNVSAGTSVFAMVVLEKQLSHSYHNLIDLVTTPDGHPVAMVHASNCTGEYDKWIGLFDEVLSATGNTISKGGLYDKLLTKALEGDKDCGGLIPYNYLSGETIVGIKSGRPLFTRTHNCHFTLANFMRAQLFTSVAALRVGMDILFEKEGVTISAINGHGGFFKTKEVGQRIMASALHTPVSILETAGEGGAWGIALLASFLVNNENKDLQSFLQTKVFGKSKAYTITPTNEDIEGFNVFLVNFKKGLPIETTAENSLS